MSNLPTDTAVKLRGHGLTVIEVDGWRTRGRPASTGGFDPVGVLCHHTASNENGRDALPLLINGRSDLPGPLCQFSLDRQGNVYLIAAGRANHAGVAKASGSVAAGDGNVLYIGIEAQNNGVGEAWPKAQYDAYVLLCAALCVEITHNSYRTVRAHKETSVTGKIDPHGPTPYEGSFDMDAFRSRVAHQINVIQNPPKPARQIRRAPRRWHPFHIKQGQFYYIEDSMRGARLALARGLGRIDFDVQKTKEGVLVVAHGPRPLAKGPTGGFHDDPDVFIDPIREHDTYADLTWDQVKRLRSNDGKGYRVHRADELIPRAMGAGIRTIELDAKTSDITAHDLKHLVSVIPSKRRKRNLVVKAFPKFMPALKAAHDVGLPFIVLTHTDAQKRIPKKHKAFLDRGFYRGKKPTFV